MRKYVPIEKRAKKERRALDRSRRSTWGAISPVTRRPENPKAYKRNKTRNWSEDSSMTAPYFFAENRTIALDKLFLLRI